jgi:hypothetical protein
MGDITMIKDVRLSLLFCIIPLISLAGPQAPVLAAHYESPTAVLNGIKEIYVSVKPIGNPGVLEAGMDESQIKAMVEQQLRKAGISLLSQEEYDRYKMTLRYPLANLEIRVTVHELEGMDTAVLDLSVRLMQVALLGRKAIVQFNAPSWESREIGLGKNLDFIVEALEKNVNFFIQDYFAANPR